MIKSYDFDESETSRQVSLSAYILVGIEVIGEER